MGLFEDLHERLKSDAVGKFKRKLILIGLSYILIVAFFAISLVEGFEANRFELFISGIILSSGMLAFSIYSVFYKNVKQLLEIKGLLQKILNSNKVYHPILKDSLNNIRESDFTYKIELPESEDIRLDEYDELLRYLRSATEKVKSSNMQNQRISFDLAKSIQKLVENSSVQASGSSQQASSVAEITATMEELARTAAQIAENSNKVAKQADNSDKSSKDGFKSVNDVILAIETIDAKMSQISEKTQVLGTQSKQIGKVLDIIYDIANETHLLALNATIESVAAGEFGKRFGVVAAEVRRLAESARENAESTRTIIEDFQNSINTTILSIDEGSQMTSNVNRTAQEISRNLTDITEAVGQTSQNANEISIATQQQRSASDQIVLTLKDVTEVTKLQAQELKKSSIELEKLNSLALNLQLLTQHVIIDAPLSLGFRIRKFASSEDIFGMDKRMHQQILHHILEDNLFIEMIYIADRDAKLFSWCVRKEKEDDNSADVLRVGTDCSNRPWFVNAANSRMPYISEVYKSLVSKEDCFSVAVGVFDDNGKFSGVLTIDINTREWNKMAL
ncbi:MAG: hypothetical protein GY757_55805 [bacterium]|nr:hypothetical protein [bacterium]